VFTPVPANVLGWYYSIVLKVVLKFIGYYKNSAK
jgi:hypothetical protein